MILTPWNETLGMKYKMWYDAHIFLSEVDEVLQINVVPVGTNVVVDEEVELIFNPVFKDKGQDTGSQLQEEDDP